MWYFYFVWCLRGICVVFVWRLSVRVKFVWCLCVVCVEFVWCLLVKVDRAGATLLEGFYTV